MTVGDAPPLFCARQLRIAFAGASGPVEAVSGVSLEVRSGEVLGLVGESGSGKSLTCRSTIRLLPHRARLTADDLSFEGRDLLALSDRELRDHRARNVGMVFQDPFSCLDPTMRVGEQIAETLRVNAGMDKSAARQRALEMMELVDIGQPDRRYLAYPHELSGGMRQRVAIAIAVSCRPKLLVADEPTTALDVTTQAQILALLQRLRQETGMALLLVSHDFGVIAQMCDRVAVMYGGYVVESGPVTSVYRAPLHPYTRALLSAIPAIESAGKRVRRTGIPGQPPGIGEILTGCPFVPRCTLAQTACTTIDMKLQEVSPGHANACPVTTEAANASPVTAGDNGARSVPPAGLPGVNAAMDVHHAVPSADGAEHLMQP